MQISFTVYGEPTPKGRPKFARMNNFVRAYTPKNTIVAERGFLEQALAHKPPKPLEGALVVSLRFYKAKPKSYPKRIVHWAKKPDIDNIIKLVLDALNKIFWNDDAQIVELHARKDFDAVPRTEVEIWEV